MPFVQSNFNCLFFLSFENTRKPENKGDPGHLRDIRSLLSGGGDAQGKPFSIAGHSRKKTKRLSYMNHSEIIAVIYRGVMFRELSCFCESSVRDVCNNTLSQLGR